MEESLGLREPASDVAREQKLHLLQDGPPVTQQGPPGDSVTNLKPSSTSKHPISKATHQALYEYEIH